MTYRQALRKRRIETTLAWPLVWLGKLFSKFFRPDISPGLFIFSPSADIGGANMNNADIAKLFAHLHPIVIFSKRPGNNQFLPLYKSPGVTLWDLSQKIDYKWVHFVNIFYRGVIAQWINSTRDAVVIGGESLYFHKVFPWLNKEVRTIELSHLDTWFNYTQQFVADIDARVFSTKRLMNDAEKFYDRQNIPSQYKSRMVFIDNMIPEFQEPVFKPGTYLEVIFIGRGSPQKRVHLVAAIAQKAHEKRLPLHFTFVGDVSSILNTSEFPYCVFHGNVKDRNRLLQIQKESDVLLLTSAFEGLPMAVMEMMSLGKVIVSTAVNAIPDYIKDGINGFLIPDNKNERMIVEDAIIALSMLAADKELLRKIGSHNFKEAKEKFGKERFFERWNNLLQKK